MAKMSQYEGPVSHAQMFVAKEAWKAFRMPTPEAWVSLLHQDISVLPFLEGAVLRMLEEYPSTFNGLSRTQNDILQILSGAEEELVKNICGTTGKGRESFSC